jgi:hypothetical protein
MLLQKATTAGFVLGTGAVSYTAAKTFSPPCHVEVNVCDPAGIPGIQSDIAENRHQGRASFRVDDRAAAAPVSLLLPKVVGDVGDHHLVPVILEPRFGFGVERGVNVAVLTLGRTPGRATVPLAAEIIATPTRMGHCVDWRTIAADPKFAVSTFAYGPNATRHFD